VGKGSVTTVVDQGLVGPKVTVNSVDMGAVLYKVYLFGSNSTRVTKLKITQ